MKNCETVGNRIKTLRIERKLSQTGLSSVIGVSRSAVASYENNLRNPDYAVLIRLASFFELSADYLLGVDSSVFKTSYYNNMLKEIHILLHSSPLENAKKEEILQELSQYLKWKIYQASKENPLHSEEEE